VVILLKTALEARSASLEEDSDLLGLYEASADRAGHDYGMVLPDRITSFVAIEAACRMTPDCHHDPQVVLHGSPTTSG
jgi:hypothetical protein